MRSEQPHPALPSPARARLAIRQLAWLDETVPSGGWPIPDTAFTTPPDGAANARPDFLKNLAAWLRVNTNPLSGVGAPTMLTYFHGRPQDTPPHHSVPWNPANSPSGSPSTVEGPYSPDQGTLDALRSPSSPLWSGTAGWRPA